MLAHPFRLSGLTSVLIIILFLPKQIRKINMISHLGELLIRSSAQQMNGLNQ